MANAMASGDSWDNAIHHYSGLTALVLINLVLSLLIVVLVIIKYWEIAVVSIAQSEISDFTQYPHSITGINLSNQILQVTERAFRNNEIENRSRQLR